MSVDAINKLLTKESGLLGLTEVTSDCRYVGRQLRDERRRSAMDAYCHRRQIHRCLHCADGWSSDVVVFTGGIENAAMVRELSPGKLGVLGFEVDHERNPAHVLANLVSSTKKVPRPAVVSQPTKNWLSRKTRAA